jgi:hypothetical protein
MYDPGWIVLTVFQGATTMSQAYQIVGTENRLSSDQLATMLSREGQWLLPLVGLIDQAECAVDEVIDVMGRADTRS